MKVISRAVLLLLVCIPAVSAAADYEQTRQGFGISFGLGGGSGMMDCSGCDNDRLDGGAGYLRLGGYVRPDLFVAFESNSFSASSHGVDYEGGFLSIALQWYPNPEKGFYLKGNLGVSGVEADDDTDQLDVAALGMGLGLGYDFRLSRNFSLTPFFNLVFSGRNDLKFNDASTGVNASFNLIQVGLGFTWH